MALRKGMPKFAGLTQTSEVSKTSEVYAERTRGEAEEPPLFSFLVGGGSHPPPLRHRLAGVTDFAPSRNTRNRLTLSSLLHCTRCKSS